MPDRAGGVVYLVGAGPGDPGLLTARGRELLGTCDAIVHDALVHPTLLTSVTAEMHDVGKRGGAPSPAQEAINDLLVRLAQAGKRVVRLKGGDPFVFGRGGEEAIALAAAGIPFEVVPGVTAGIAAPAYAGIPVTHRDLSASVTFVTGTEGGEREGPGTDWSALARVGGTIVLYMGVARLTAITEQLIAGGLLPETPAAVIEWGTYGRQRSVVGTARTIPELATASGVRAPAITVIGRVVTLRRELRWFDTKPLAGRRIVVTRARAQTSTLAAQLHALGADVLEAPAIRIEPLDRSVLMERVARLADYQWLVLSSANAVLLVWDALRAAGLDARALAVVRVAVVGPATADALGARGIVADVVPDRFVAEGLVETLRARDDVRGARVFYPRGEQARDVLTTALREMGALVDDLAIYRSVADVDGAARLRSVLDEDAVDLVTFTSASTVRHFVDAVGVERARSAHGASIGPVTTAAARELGVPIVTEADEATVDGLVRAIARAVRNDAPET